MAFADLPERRSAGRSRRDAYQDPRPRKLTPERESELRRVAPGRSLRDLAAKFGVSHETVRAALRVGKVCVLTPTLTHQQVNGPKNRRIGAENGPWGVDVGRSTVHQHPDRYEPVEVA